MAGGANGVRAAGEKSGIVARIILEQLKYYHRAITGYLPFPIHIKARSRAL